MCRGQCGPRVGSRGLFGSSGRIALRHKFIGGRIGASSVGSLGSRIASLALACDMVVACQAASFMLPFAKIGLIPDTACSWLVPQRLGQARALGLAMTGNKLPAAKAAEWGLIWDAVAEDVFADAVQQLAEQLATMPTKALVRTRQAMQAGRTNTLEQQLTLEGLYMRELGRSSDYVEGVSAFLEKRPPRFTGA